MSRLRSGDLPVIHGTTSKRGGQPHVPAAFVPPPLTTRQPPYPPQPRLLRSAEINLTLDDDEDNIDPATADNVSAWSQMGGAAAAFSVLGFLYIHVVVAEQAPLEELQNFLLNISSRGVVVAGPS